MSKTLIVSDYGQKLQGLHAQVLNFKEYLAQYPKANEPKTRVINLCNTEQYLSEGYYCSLLAEARQHEVLPSVSSIIDCSSSHANNLSDSPKLDALQFLIPDYLFKALNSVGKKQNAFSIHIYCGNTSIEGFSRVANYIFQRCKLPILQADFTLQNKQWLVKVHKKDLLQLSEQEFSELYLQLDKFTQQVWRTRIKTKKYRWDMAILVNSKEATPPSDKKALKYFVKAASQLGINAQLVEYDHSTDYTSFLASFDALFIRETTSIKSHTYELARVAQNAGLVVIDDPSSILRCCNKVFLHDAFSYHKVPSPKTMFITDGSAQTIDHLETTFGFPMVLKLPESAFSLGVYKVSNRLALEEKLSDMFAASAVVLVQEYLFTQYDWRIGVLNNKPLYACRYYMAPNHWQIYNHSNNSESGDAQTLPTFEVPKHVLTSALKACSFIGNGLYGVDIKESNEKAFVIEVNDNPSIDADVEDKYLGKDLYMQIMQEFVHRLEARGRS